MFIETGLIAKNKKAYHDYFVEDEIECGIILVGSEVKSLRINKCNLRDSHADIRTKNGVEEIWLQNVHIPEYKFAGRFNHKPKHDRKLLLHKKEIKKLIGKKEQKGYTLIPLSIYFNNRGLVKVKLGLCKGKTKYDKRQVLKDRDWDRQKQRMLKDSD
jgi:SsrA-binding protein